MRSKTWGWGFLRGVRTKGAEGGGEGRGRQGRRESLHSTAPTTVEILSSVSRQTDFSNRYEQMALVLSHGFG